MPDYDAMTHKELAAYASWLRSTGKDTLEEMEKMRVAARKRPQEITGTIGKVV
jgi:hypothetical protein